MGEMRLPTDPVTANRGNAAAASPLDVSRLVIDHHRSLYRYAFRLTGSVPDAEDLTQQTYLMAQQRVGQVRQPERIRSWLFAVLRSCYLKSRRRRTPLSAADLQIDVEGVPQHLPREEDIDRERLQAAIDELPDEFKLVVVMFYFDQCSYKQIAAELEIPIGTVMSRLSRAKAHLRKRLTNTETQSKSTRSVGY